jgi:hypothetical protein
VNDTLSPSDHVEAWMAVQAKRRERERHRGPLATSEAFRPGSPWFGSMLGPAAVVMEGGTEKQDDAT